MARRRPRTAILSGRAETDSVSQNTAQSFGNYAIGSATGVSLSSTGNAVVAIPILSGGLTVGSAANNSGSVIVRRVTVSILTSNDGNASNAVVAASVLGNLTAVGLFQDLTVASPYSTTTTIDGTKTQALFVKVNTAVAGTVDIRVYGDTVNF